MEVRGYLQDLEGNIILDGLLAEPELLPPVTARWVSIVIDLTPHEQERARSLAQGDDLPSEFTPREDGTLLQHIVDYHGNGAAADLEQDQASYERFLAFKRRLQEPAGAD